MTVLIFDFDDTLIFSQSDRALRLKSAIRRFGHQVDEDSLSLVWGKPFRRMVTTIAPSIEGQFEDFLQFYAAELAKTPPRACPGTVEAIPQLARHARLLVHSASDSLLVRTDLHSLGLLPLFDFVCGSDWQATPKPDPESLDFIWKLPGFEKMARSEVYYIGDSSTDADIAEHAGVHFVRTHYAESSRQQYFKMPYPSVTNLEELFIILGKALG